MTDPRPLTEEERQAWRDAANRCAGWKTNVSVPPERLFQLLDLLEQAELAAVGFKERGDWLREMLERAEARAAEWKESAERLEARAVRAEARAQRLLEERVELDVDSGTEAPRE